MQMHQKTKQVVPGKIWRLALSSVFLLLLFPIGVLGQAISSDLQKMAEHIEQAIRENHPEWKFQRIVPVLESENVIIDQWNFGDIGVRVSFVPFKSGHDAKEALEDFAKHTQCNEAIPGLGDAACWFGGTGTELAFRRGRITVYISSAVQMGLDPSVDKMMEPKDAIAAMKKLSKEVGQHAAKAIDTP